MHRCLDGQIHRLASDPYGEEQKYGGLRSLTAFLDWDGVIAQLKAAALAVWAAPDFPPASKWEAVPQPGTIKDRFILQSLPHLVIEGMIIAGPVTGAQKGILYIRHEYQVQGKILHHEIQRCYREGILGKSVMGSRPAFELELFVSPGGYICGEETLLEAIEGKRAEPRNKPPFPVINGVFNKPTALNLPHATFDHQSHQMVSCVSCHAQASASQETADVDSGRPNLPAVPSFRIGRRRSSLFRVPHLSRLEPGKTDRRQIHTFAVSKLKPSYCNKRPALDVKLRNTLVS